MGLTSNGGVHSSFDHLFKLCDISKEYGIENTFIHCFMDGRDTDPKSGKGFIEQLTAHCEKSAGKIASIVGRFYAMDRDKRWERVKVAYDLLVNGEGKVATDMVQAMQESYDEGVTDEFIKPIVNGGFDGTIKEGDVVIFFNYRNDRAKELTVVLTQQDMPEQGMQTIPGLQFYCMTPYDASFKGVHILFDKENVQNTLGEYLAANGKTQLHIAETEKYAHVTFFFNGGRETPYDAEERILVPSPKVATYDLKPEMSAYEVKDKLVEAIKTQKFDFIVVNYANGDMVGHTGIYEAIEKAVKAIDECVKDTVEAAKANDYEVIIIADHGNADHALNEDGTPNTAHSLNPVPFVYVTANKDAKVENGVLADVAPFYPAYLGYGAIPYYEKRYGKKIRPISRRSECDIPDSCTCPRCDAPKPFLYKNNGSKGQLLCKICDARFSPDESRFSAVKLRCPHCGNTLVPKKDRKHFIVHKCVNPKCSYYLHNLKKVDKADLKEDYGKNKYKLHYIYREFTMDFFSMDLNTLPKNASSLKFSKHNAHVMSLCLTLHVNLGLSLRKTSQALKDLYNISISHQQIANYCKTAAICIKPFVDQYPYEKNEVFTADETYIKIRGIKTYVWLIMNAATRSILGYQVSDNRGVGPCILAMRMAFQNLKKLPENFKFIADGYSAYPLAAMEFAKKFGKDFTFSVTQVIGLTNDDAVSTEHRPFKQMVERLNRTYKASYRHTNGFDNIDGANYDLALWVAYYNFLRPHKHAGYKVLNEVEMLQGADNMPGKWQLLIFLGQQTILNIQKNGTAASERNCCQ